MDVFHGDVPTENVKIDSEQTAQTAIVLVNLEHNHDNDAKKLERLQLRAQVKQKASEDMTSRPSKSIITGLHKFADNLLESRDIRCITQLLYRKRWKVYPVLPKTGEEVHHALDSMDTASSKDEYFVLEKM